MNKDSISFRNSGAYTSPGSPDNGRGIQKGWYSERVPFSTSSNGNQRRTSVNVLMPFNNGRAFPSKWDDAERWITSPVSGSGFCKNSADKVAPPQRRAKSKSGPLGPAVGDVYFSNYSPGFSFLESGSRNRNHCFDGSPLTTGVLVPSGYSFHHDDGIDENSEYRLASSGSAPVWSDLLIEPSYLESQDEKIDENYVNCLVSRRDMATQMSPVESPESSPKGRQLLSNSPPPIPSPVEPKNRSSARVEVRDVQVDKRVTMTKQPKGVVKRMEKNESTEIKDLALTWNRTEGAMELSKIQKEEARIVAWENLQNAKAEASIRKLEMKLEKKKSASMDKIMSKLRKAQLKAQEMRKTMSDNQAPRTSRKIMSFPRYPKISLTPCFRFHHT